MTFSEDRVKGPYSEMDAQQIFTDGGLDWGTRTERYVNLKDTIFEEISGQWWIAFNEENKPVASQGLGSFGNVYLLLGLFSKQKGYGKAIANYVVGNHGDKPILGSALGGGGIHIFPSIGFRKLKFDGDFLQGEEDIPTEVKSALEIAQGKGMIGLRKFFYRPTSSWWVMLKAERPWEKPTLGEKVSIWSDEVINKYMNFMITLYNSIATNN